MKRLFIFFVVAFLVDIYSGVSCDFVTDLAKQSKAKQASIDFFCLFDLDLFFPAFLGISISSCVFILGILFSGELGGGGDGMGTTTVGATQQPTAAAEDSTGSSPIRLVHGKGLFVCEEGQVKGGHSGQDFGMDFYGKLVGLDGWMHG